MSSLLINLQVNGAGTNLRLDEYDFLNYRHHVSRFSPFSSTSGSDYPTLLPYCKARWNMWRPTHQLDTSLVSEESTSSTQSDGATGYSSYRYPPLQDPIGTPRRPGATYLGDMHHSPVPLREMGRQREKFKANVVHVSAAESHPLNHVSVEIKGIPRNAENMHHRCMYTGDLLSDQDEYLPRRPAPPRFSNAPLPLSKESTRLPRLYAHNARIRACTDDAVRRMRMQARNPKQNYPFFRRDPFPIGGSNPFRESRRRAEEPFGHIIRSIDRLVQEDDEETLTYLESRLCRERMLKEVRHGPAVPSFGGHDRSPVSPPQPQLQTRSHLDEGCTRRSEPEAGLFDDFPVCEMSIAMGLHDSCR